MKNIMALTPLKIKKAIVLFMGIIAVTTNSLAQDDISDLRDRPMVGLKIGANFSNVYDEQGDNFVADPKFGLAAGAFAVLPFDKYIGLQPEILFSQKGFNGTGTLLGETYSLSRTTSYIDVPIYFALKPSKCLTLMAGPQFSYLVAQRDVISNGTKSYLQEQEFKNENVRKNILCITGGIDITLNRSVIGLRAGWDIQNNHGDGTSNTPRYKNVWYQATIGFRLYR